MCVEEIDVEFGEGQKGRELESECIFYRASREVISSEALFLEPECIVLCKVTLVCHFLWEQGARFFN